MSQMNGLSQWNYTLDLGMSLMVGYGFEMHAQDLK